MIWTTGEGWQPIGGNFRSFFSATFNGNGYTISNLMINRSNTSSVGLFSDMLQGSEITNLGLLNVNIIRYSDVGGLVGLNGGTITNSYAAGSVLGDDDVGGLVGDNLSRVTNNYATSSASGDNNVGGLVGRSDNGTAMNSY